MLLATLLGLELDLAGVDAADGAGVGDRQLSGAGSVVIRWSFDTSSFVMTCSKTKKNIIGQKTCNISVVARRSSTHPISMLHSY